MDGFFRKKKDRGDDIEKKAEKAGKDIVVKLIEARRKSKAEWAAQPKDVRDTYFWSKVLTFIVLIPTMLTTVVALKIALATSVAVSAFPAVCLHRRNFKLSLVPMFCCAFGMLFGLVTKAVLYFLVIRNIQP